MLMGGVPHQNVASLQRAFLPAFSRSSALFGLISRGQKFARVRGISDGNTPAREEPSKCGPAALELCREVVTMVQSAEAGQGMNAAPDCRTSLDWAPRWGVFRQPQMRPILVVIADILSHELQMPLI